MHSNDTRGAQRTISVEAGGAPEAVVEPFCAKVPKKAPSMPTSVFVSMVGTQGHGNPKAKANPPLQLGT
jgi:hypothetical protein